MGTHQEYISGRKFNSSIKNLLRDYYTYGFKGADDYIRLTDSQMAKKFKVSEEQMAKIRNAAPDDIEATIDSLDVDEKIKEKLKQNLKSNKVSTKTFTDDWNRLNSILKDYAVWSEGRERNRRTFLTTDSQSMDINPFQRVYRFSGEDRPKYLYYFFHSMSALSDVFLSSEELITIGSMKANYELNNQQKALIKEIVKMDLDESNRRHLLSLYNNPKRLLAKANSLHLSGGVFGGSYKSLKDIIDGRRSITSENSCLSLEEVWEFALSISKEISKDERRIIRLIETMDMDIENQRHLRQFYNDLNLEGILKKAEECLQSQDHILRLQDAKSSSIKLKTSEFVKFYPLEEVENLFERLHISEDKKGQLRAHFADATEFLKEAKQCGLSEDQYYSLEYAIIGTTDDMKTVIERMNLDQSVKDKLNKSLNGNNVDNVLRMAKKLLKDKLPEDFEKRIGDISQATIDTVIDGLALKDRVKKKLRRSLEENNIDNLIETARDEELSDIQIIRLQEAARERDEKKERAYKATTVNNRLQRYCDFGVMQCDQNTGKSGDLNGHRKWSLAPLTLRKILCAGEKVDDHFRNHLQAVLDFYSKTFLFGEIGMYLMDRFGEKYDSPIRIKHEYFMHSLNDFNVIDLMNAIENKEWCLVTYKRENIDTQLLVYPLELRIGSTTGREYLMYYEPVKMSCTSLRLEFIESIQYYHDAYVRECLSDDDSDKDLQIDRNLEKARLLLEYVWGVSTGNVHEKNVKELKNLFKTVTFRVKYQKDKDYYVLNRLYRESRIGRISVNAEDSYIEFSVTTTDAGELIPFLRGFYSRILSCTGIDEKQFSLETDIADMVSQYIPERAKKTKLEDVYNREEWRIDKDVLNRLGTGLNASEHEKIFNEIFSIEYHVFADLLGRIYSGNSKYTEQEIVQICKTVLNDYEKERRSTTDTTVSYRGTLINDYELLLRYLKEGGFLVPIAGKQNHYISRYRSEAPVNLYKDVIPLTYMEVRWLKTILEDDKISYFLSDNEVLSLRLILAEYAIEVNPFPMHTVNYFDRYKFSKKKEWKESVVLNRILNAIRNQKILEIGNIGNPKKVHSKFYMPVLIEYSKRNNCFQGYFREYRKGKDKGGFQSFNLAQIVLLEETEKSFDWIALKMEFQKWHDDQMKEVHLEFPDVNNIADRVLTQFSPWKKECEFDREKGIYHLKIFYPGRDGKDMVTRLLGFGSEIRLIENNHTLSRMIRHRLDDQINLIEKPQVRMDERTDTVR